MATLGCTIGSARESAIGSACSSAFSSARAVRSRLASLVLLLLALYATAGNAQGIQPGGPVDFGSVALGSSSLNLTLTFSATATTTITAVATATDGAASKDFQLIGQTCTGTLGAGQSCNVTIAFEPLQIGLRHGALSITESSGSFRQYLHGIGLGPQLVFSPVSASALSALPSNLSPLTYKSSSAVYDGAGNLYFDDYANGRILEQTSATAVSLVTSLTTTAHSSMAINGAGTLYISLPSQGLVQAVLPGASSAVLATPGVTLVSPAGVAVDAGGNIYIADSQANQIVRVSYDGSTASVVPMTGLAKPLSSPYGLAVDNNFLYIADSGNGRIVELSLSTGAATALTASGALSSPYGLIVDAAGTLVVANAGGSDVVQVSPLGAVYSFTPDYGISLGSSPLGITLKSTGDIVVEDATLGLVTVTRSTGSLTFPTPTKVGFLDSVDGYENVTVQNSGNQAIQIGSTSPAISSTAFATGTANTCPVLASTSTPLAIAATCKYAVGFTPLIVGANTATLAVSGTAVTTLATITADANLTGTGITPVDTLSVVATPASTAPGAPVSFTVSALEGTTVITAFTGTVTFTMTDSTGKFLSGTSYTFTAADAGVHTFTAAAGAQFNQTGTFTIGAHLGSIVGVSNSVVVQYVSTIGLTSSVNPVFINANTSLTATISAPGVSTPATGTVTFYDGAATLGTCTLAAGTCSLPVNFTVAGNHSLTAYYGGDTNYGYITSSALIQVVTDFTATVTIVSSINPSIIGQQTVFTATVAATPGQGGAGTPTGTVTFKEGATLIGVVTLVNGVASIPDTFTTTGNHFITAAYSGDTSFGPVTPPAYTQIVNGYAAQATLTSSINPSIINQSTTLTATISAVAGQSGAGTPTGTVTFKNGTATLGTGTLVNGVATLPASFSAPGSYSLIVVYAGDANFVASTSAILIQVVNTSTSQIALTSSINPSFVNQSTTLTATVAGTPGQTATPTGTITFKSGTTTLSTVTLVGGIASLPQSFALAGSYSITAVYSGDTNFVASTSTVLTQVVKSFAETVTLSSSINPSAINQTTTLTVTVTAVAGQTGSVTPTGSVNFQNGITVLGTGTLVNGVATLSASFAVAGSYPLTVLYSGDARYPTQTSGVLTQVVNGFTAVATLTSSVNPSFPTQQTTLKATVAAAPGQPGAVTPTGTVTFNDGATLLGTATLVAGVGTLSTSFAASGNHPLTCAYSGDTNYAAAACGQFTQQVAKFPTTPVLSVTPKPVFINQPTAISVAINATTSPVASPPIPTGTVAYYDGANGIGTTTLVNGVPPILPFTFTTPGAHVLTCVYSGDSNYLANTCISSTETVNQYVAQAVLTSSLNPSFIGQPVTYTANITALPGQTGSPVPTGTVTFYDGTAVLATDPLPANGIVAFTSNPSAGSHNITCIYSGDTNYTGTTCNAVTQVVNNYTAQISLTSSINPSFVNQQTVLTANVSAVAGQTGSVAPTGPVSFYSGTFFLGSAQLVAGVATFSASFPAAGSYAITAVYNGSATYSPVTSSIVTQVVNLYTVGVTFASSNNPSFIDATTVLSATIIPIASQNSPFLPTGTVTFMLGATVLGVEPVAAGGTAMMSVSFSIIGSYSLTAVYSGDANFMSAPAPSLTQLVGDFTIATAAGTSGSATVLGGYATSYTLTVTPIGPPLGFPGPISFSLTGFPLGTTATFAPASLTAGLGATNVILTVKPPPIAQAHLDPTHSPAQRGGSAAHYAPVVLALLMLPFAARRRRRRFTSLCLWLLLLCASAAGLTGCVTDASSGYYGTQPQTSTLTVTAYSGTLAHSTTLTLVVQ